MLLVMRHSIAKVLSPERQKVYIPQTGTLFWQCIKYHELWNPLGNELLAVSSKYRLERGFNRVLDTPVKDGPCAASRSERPLKLSGSCRGIAKGTVAVCPCLDLLSISAWYLRQDTEPDAPVAVIKCFMRALQSYIAGAWSIRQYTWPHCSTQDLCGELLRNSAEGGQLEIIENPSNYLPSYVLE